MAYQSGTFTNSHELITILYGFLRAMGWREVSALKGGAYSQGYDFVMHSTGSKNNHDVYIRISAGLADKYTEGHVQLPYEDGYTEYINAFAYQYFPEAGNASDGCGELGVYGPILYNIQNYGTSETIGDADEYNFWVDAGESKFPRIKIYDYTGNSFTSSTGGVAFDARQYLWQFSYPNISTIDLYTKSLWNANLSGTGTPALNNTATGMVVLKDGAQYVYTMRGALGPNEYHKILTRTNMSSLIVEYLIGNIPPFTLNAGGTYYRPYNGMTLVGTKRKRFGGPNNAPQHRLLYCFAGQVLEGNNGSTEWTYADAETCKFHPTLITPALPWTTGSYGHNGYAVYATKEATGYANDRIYYFRGEQQTGFASIAIDDDGYVTGSWSVHEQTPLQQHSGHAAFILGKYIYWVSGANYTGYNGNDWYRWQLPTNPTDYGSWSLVKADGSYSGFGLKNPLVKVHYHLCNRAHVSEFETNTYWAFGDKDHLTVVVKDANGRYNYIYAGLFQPYADERFARTTSSATAGDMSFQVDDPSLFTIGQKYQILAAVPDDIIEYVSGMTGETKKLLPSEIFTVYGKSGPTLFVSQIKNNYSIGAKVGEDPMPAMVRVHSLEYAQTLNMVNVNSNAAWNDFNDVSWQRYKLTPSVSTAFANATDYDDRTHGTLLYGILLLNTGDSFKGKEVRGQMIDVYACGTSVSSEQEIYVGSRKYIAFDIYESGESLRIVVGPKE